MAAVGRVGGIQDGDALGVQRAIPWEYVVTSVVRSPDHCFKYSCDGWVRSENAIIKEQADSDRPGCVGIAHALTSWQRHTTCIMFLRPSRDDPLHSVFDGGEMARQGPDT